MTARVIPFPGALPIAHESAPERPRRRIEVCACRRHQADPSTAVCGRCGGQHMPTLVQLLRRPGGEQLAGRLPTGVVALAVEMDTAGRLAVAQL